MTSEPTTTSATTTTDGDELDRVADRLVEQARTDGVALTGPGGLLGGLTGSKGRTFPHTQLGVTCIVAAEGGTPIDVSMLNRGGQRHDRARVEPAREAGPDRHVTPQPEADRIVHKGQEEAQRHAQAADAYATGVLEELAEKLQVISKQVDNGIRMLQENSPTAASPERPRS